MRQFLAPTFCLLFGLYCIIAGFLEVSVPASLRVGGAFLGLCVLALGAIYLRIIQPHDQGNNRAI